jgi:proteasome accessory factor B
MVNSVQTGSRSTRLAQIQHLLQGSSHGLTTSELARLCGVSVRTVQRDLAALDTDLRIPLTQQGSRYGILSGYVLPPVSFSLYEAAALFLASRLVLRQTDEDNPHIESALGRLSTALPPGLGKRLKASIEAIRSRRKAPEFIRIFEQVAAGWATRQRLRLGYRSLHSDEVREWLLDPYFMEMSGVGYSTYVIGQASREGRSGIITFKLDRIQEADLLDESFEVPQGLELDGLLGSSWGVIWGEEVEVKLRFSPNVARRVKESVWHPSQVIEDLPDGGCLFTVRVASTLEMTPWIRGWGPDVEVLGPPSVREEFRRWAAELQRVYTQEAARE